MKVRAVASSRLCQELESNHSTKVSDAFFKLY